MAMNERDFFIEKPETRPAYLTCPLRQCRHRDTYQIRWVRRTMAMTVVIIEHDMALVKELADHVFVLHQGRLLAEGDVPTVRADQRVHEVYVGVTE